MSDRETKILRSEREGGGKKERESAAVRPTGRQWADMESPPLPPRPPLPLIPPSARGETGTESGPVNEGATTAVKKAPLPPRTLPHATDRLSANSRTAGTTALPRTASYLTTETETREGTLTTNTKTTLMSNTETAVTTGNQGGPPSAVVPLLLPPTGLEAGTETHTPPTPPAGPRPSEAPTLRGPARAALAGIRRGTSRSLWSPAPPRTSPLEGPPRERSPGLSVPQ